MNTADTNRSGAARGSRRNRPDEGVGVVVPERAVPAEGRCPSCGLRYHSTFQAIWCEMDSEEGHLPGGNDV
jgi:hypothetical protein